MSSGVRTSRKAKGRKCAQRTGDLIPASRGGKAFSFEITIGGNTSAHKGELTAEQWEILQEFGRRVDEMQATAWGKRGFAIDHNLVCEAGKGLLPADTSSHPSRAELSQFLHDARSILLQNERTYFPTVLSILPRKAPNPAWRVMLHRFTGKRFRDAIRIYVEPVEGPDARKRILLNSEEIFRRWLNDFEFHKDEERAAYFKHLHGEEFADHLKGLILSMLADQASAGVMLRGFIRTMEFGKGASIAYDLR